MPAGPRIQGAWATWNPIKNIISYIICNVLFWRWLVFVVFDGRWTAWYIVVCVDVVVFFKAVKIGSSKWTTNCGVVRKKATTKMKRFARIFFISVNLLFERLCQFISFGGGANQTSHLLDSIFILDFGAVFLHINHDLLWSLRTFFAWLILLN